MNKYHVAYAYMTRTGDHGFGRITFESASALRPEDLERLERRLVETHVHYIKVTILS